MRTAARRKIAEPDGDVVAGEDERERAEEPDPEGEDQRQRERMLGESDSGRDRDAGAARRRLRAGPRCARRTTEGSANRGWVRGAHRRESPSVRFARHAGRDTASTSAAGDHPGRGRRRAVLRGRAPAGRWPSDTTSCSPPTGRARSARPLPGRELDFVPLRHVRRPINPLRDARGPRRAHVAHPPRAASDPAREQLEGRRARAAGCSDDPGAGPHLHGPRLGVLRLFGARVPALSVAPTD